MTATRSTMTPAEAVLELRPYVHAGTEVTVMVTRVNRDGDSRTMRLFVPKDDHVVEITSVAARAAGFTLGSSGGMLVSGGGMDMTKYAVERLAQALGLPGPYSGAPRSERVSST